MNDNDHVMTISVHQNLTASLSIIVYISLLSLLSYNPRDVPSSYFWLVSCLTAMFAHWKPTFDHTPCWTLGHESGETNVWWLWWERPYSSNMNETHRLNEMPIHILIFVSLESMVPCKLYHDVGTLNVWGHNWLVSNKARTHQLGKGWATKNQRPRLHCVNCDPAIYSSSDAKSPPFHLGPSNEGKKSKNLASATRISRNKIRSADRCEKGAFEIIYYVLCTVSPISACWIASKISIPLISLLWVTF